MRHPDRGSLQAVGFLLGISVAVGVATADDQTPGLFSEDVQKFACRVHKPQPAANGDSWQEVCRVDGYETLFDPDVQYPDEPGSPYESIIGPCSVNDPDQDWPLCLTDTSGLTNPDLGYRYPRITTSAVDWADIHQDPATEWWVVCTDATLSNVVSNPQSQECPTGLQAIGECRASAGHFEDLSNNAAAHPAETFYSFVFTHPDCEPCGHDVYSIVDACKHRCNLYFKNIAFDRTDGTTGKWKDRTDPSWPTDVPDPEELGTRFIDVAMDTLEIGGNTNVAGRTPLDACLDFCGPPRQECLGNPTTCDPLAHLAPPWVSDNRKVARDIDEREDMWHWTTYDRGRNGDEAVAMWMRSYAVNVDHRTPTNECKKPIIYQYCSTVVPTGTPNRTAKRTECRKALLRTDMDLDGDGVDETMEDYLIGYHAKAKPDPAPWDLTTDGMCEAFSHANLHCLDSCYQAGGNGEQTDNVCGVDVSAVGLPGLPGGECDNATALCQCEGPSGDEPCIKLCGTGVQSDDLPCNQLNIVDGDCCTRTCTLELEDAPCDSVCVQGGTCTPCTDPSCYNPLECTGGTCDTSATCGCGSTCALVGSDCVCP